MGDRERLLAIYLNDHLTGATLGVEVARRTAASNRGDPIGEPLAAVCAEIEEDFETLKRLMGELGVRRDRFKPAMAWAGEKLGRLKPNGQLTGYSPLSRLLELEFLSIGIAGKAELWNSLGQSFDGRLGELDFEALMRRAEHQRDVIQELHLHAAARALPPPSPRPSS